MRHYLFCVAFSCAQSLLPGGMFDRTRMAPLIACTGTPTAVLPANRGAITCTINLTPITATADVHLLATACAAIHPMRFDGFHCTAHPGKHWTKPCRKGIKARRPCPCGARRKKARDSAKNLSGPSLFGQPGQNNADAVIASRGTAITTIRNSNAALAIPSSRTATTHPDTPLPIRVAAELLTRLLWSKHKESRGFMSRLTLWCPIVQNPRRFSACRACSAHAPPWCNPKRPWGCR